MASVVWPRGAEAPVDGRCVAHQPAAAAAMRIAAAMAAMRPRGGRAATGAAAGVFPLRLESESRFRRFRSVFSSAALW